MRAVIQGTDLHGTPSPGPGTWEVTFPPEHRLLINAVQVFTVIAPASEGVSVGWDCHGKSLHTAGCRMGEALDENWLLT